MDSSEFIPQVLQETLEREKCGFNVLAYEVPGSSSTTTSERISEGKASFLGVFTSLGSTPPTCLKYVRLGKPKLGASRPLKIIFDSKEKASSLPSTYNDLKQNGSNFPSGFHIVRDKTLLQRQQLRACHAQGLEPNRKEPVLEPKNP